MLGGAFLRTHKEVCVFQRPNRELTTRNACRNNAVSTNSRILPLGVRFPLDPSFCKVFFSRLLVPQRVSDERSNVAISVVAFKHVVVRTFDESLDFSDGNLSPLFARDGDHKVWRQHSTSHLQCDLSLGHSLLQRVDCVLTRVEVRAAGWVTAIWVVVSTESDVFQSFAVAVEPAVFAKFLVASAIVSECAIRGEITLAAAPFNPAQDLLEDVLLVV